MLYKTGIFSLCKGPNLAQNGENLGSQLQRTESKKTLLIAGFDNSTQRASTWQGIKKSDISKLESIVDIYGSQLLTYPS